MQAAAQMGMEDKQEALRAQYEAEQVALRQEVAATEQRELEELRLFKAQHEELEKLRRFKASVAAGAPVAAAAPRHASDGVLLGAPAPPPRRRPGAGASPAADALVPYAETKRILHNKFKAQIVTPMERELMSARAEISYLSGVLQEGSPEYAAVMQRVHNEFRSEGITVSAIHTRKKRFDKMPGELQALEDELSRVLEQLSVKRLRCQLYAQKVKDDELALARLRVTDREKQDMRTSELDAKKRRQVAAEQEREEKRRRAEAVYEASAAGFGPIKRSQIRENYANDLDDFIMDAADEDEDE
jgi:hypothetical protein